MNKIFVVHSLLEFHRALYLASVLLLGLNVLQFTRGEMLTNFVGGSKTSAYKANNCKLLVSRPCQMKYTMRVGVYLLFNIKDIKESPSTPNCIFSQIQER